MIEGKLIRQTGGAAGKIDFIYGAFGMIRNGKSCEPKTIEFVIDADLYYAIQHMTMLVTYDKRKKGIKLCWRTHMTLMNGENFF